MSEQTHSGTGDNVAGNKTEIDRQVNMGPRSTYVDKRKIYGERKIPRHLTPPPFIPEIFQGRDDDLQAVHQKLFAGNNLLLLVNGEGGIGKTTLAAKYWQRYEADYKHTAWVFAQKNLLDALLTLASPLQVDFPEAMPAPERLQKMLAAMANLERPCLLIIDNANDMRELEKYYLSLRCCSNFHLLLTTRITQFEHAETYPIKPLAEEDALQLFKKHYPKHQNDEDELLKSIRTSVGGNTLVMELLAKNLAAINTDEIFYSLADLLQDLQKRGLLQLSQTEKVTIADKGNSLALKKAQPTDIIGALYDEVEMVVPLTEVEQRLLSNLAVLPAENFPYTLLKTLLACPDAKEFSSALTDLAKRGWLEKSVQKDDSFYKISPVVQEITRHKNKANLLNYCETLINTLIEKLNYQPGVGHFLNASYEEAAFYSRYAEAVIVCFQETDYKLSLLCECIGNYHKTTGNLSQALKYFIEYNCLTKELLKVYPNNLNFKHSLAVSYEKLGTTHTTLGNLGQALRLYEKFNRLEKELYQVSPDDVDFKNGLATACQYLGTAHIALGNLDQALGLCEECHRLEKELYEAYPKNVEFKHGLAISCQHLARTHTGLGNLDQVLGFYKEYHRLEKELYQAYPNNVEFKHNLAISCQHLARTHRAQGSMDQALRLHEEDLRLSKELYEAYPNNVAFKNSLAISCQHLGNMHTALGNLDQVLGFYKAYYRLEKELYEAYPDNMSFKNSLAISCQRLGTTHTSLGNLDQALRLYEEDLRLSKELYEAYPGNVEFKNSLAISCQFLGNTHIALGNLEQALDLYEEYQQLENELYGAYPDNVNFKDSFAISCQYLGYTHSLLGNLEQALRLHEEYQRLEKELYEAYPDNVEFKHNLAISCQFLGNTQAALGNLEQALGLYEEYQRLEKELYETYPDNVKFKEGLAFSFIKLGLIFEKIENETIAKEHYEQSKMLLEQLVSNFPYYVEFKKNLDFVEGRLTEKLQK